MFGLWFEKWVGDIVEDNHYSIFTESVIQLAESIVIKSADTAAAINDELYIRLGPGSVDKLDPTTWKYYLNVSGSYHFDDTVMTVISMDTLETINFTKENLQFHRTTARAYEYGGKYYKELLARYPTQERLILGILYPCEIATAIEAKDGTILSFPPHLVEDHEYSFVNNLQQWIYSYLVRWDNVQFKLSDNLYTATMLGVMYMNLVPAIINLRKKACKTNEVHSFHLRQYLASHGMLDSYLVYLTRRQALWLYRNIAYIERNSGKQAVFEWLMEHIMTLRGLPLAAYEMRHDLEGMPANLKPVVSFEKLPLNTDYNFDLKDTFSLTQVMDKEDPLARDNIKYRSDEQTTAARQMEYSKANQLQTKLLESSIVDFTGSERYTLADTLLSHWLWLSQKGHYRAYVSVTSPLTGELLVMTANEAFIFYVYALCSTMHITLEKLPKVIAERVMRLPRPTVDDLMSVVNPKVVPRSFAQEMLLLQPVPQPMISVDSFYEFCQEVQKAALLQYGYAASEQLMNARGQKMGLISRCWADVGLQLGQEDVFYVDWFAARNVTISEYTPAHLATLAVDLLEAATGMASSKAITVKDIQQAMIRLMAQLSSYSVQYTSSINQGPVLDAGESGTRPDDIRGKNNYHKDIVMATTVIKTEVEQSMGLELDIGSETFDERLEVRQGFATAFEITVEPALADGALQYQNRSQMSVDITYELPELGANPRGVTNVIGIDKYLSLSDEDQQTIPDFWLPWTEPSLPANNLAITISSVLDGFQEANQSLSTAITNSVDGFDRDESALSFRITESGDRRLTEDGDNLQAE